jgi:4-diphosphocytidyl-2-C-methyl-D-erythritol kinase
VDADSVSWPAPAKLNLFLHVTGRRPDGYHTLQTVFQFVDFGDRVGLRVTADSAIRRANTLADILEDKDLTVRAARLLQAEAGVKHGVEITTDKRIPLGGGLGGGSSDAATVLLALNRLWRLDWPVPRLATLGLRLGADVPVFVSGHAAWAEGVGEVLTPVDLPCPWYVVIVPPVQVPTARVFAALAEERRLTGYSSAITIRDFRAGLGHNDLEPVVRRLYPEVDRALAWLADFGDARMTGSGASVFVAAAGVEEARRIFAKRPAGYGGFVAQGLNTHPFHAGLNG